jgi:hypothetical protein
VDKVKKFILKNEQKGQSGAVFRLMIDAIVGIAILAIILGTLNHFETLQFRASVSEFSSKVSAAANSPDGSVLVSENDLSFKKGTAFTSVNMQELTGYYEDCFEFTTNRGLIEIKDGGKAAEFLENTNTKLYVKCVTTGDVADIDEVDVCEIECTISFGEKLESDIVRTD